MSPSCLLVLDDRLSIKCLTHLALVSRQSADDLVGRVVVSLKELMKNPNEQHDREDHLSGFEDADSMPGTISWSIGYYDKVRFLVYFCALGGRSAYHLPSKNSIALGSIEQGNSEQA